MDATAVILTAVSLVLLVLTAAMCYRLGRAVGWTEGFNDGVCAASVPRPLASLARHRPAAAERRRIDQPANPSAWRMP